MNLVNTVSKLAAFGVGVAAIFGGAMAVGAAVGPIDVGGNDAHSVEATAAVIQSDMPRGLAVSADGFRLVVDSDSVLTDSASRFAFRIVDDTGSAVTDFDELHERPLHLIVVARNLVDYWHLHPTLDDIGVWTVDLPALAPGSYRVFADFQPAGGANITLGTDVTVPGTVTSVGPPEPSPTDDVDGYTVRLSGDPQIGEAELTFSVALHGETVRTEPYLGAAGHLVAIRDGDMAFLHVHPHEDDASDAVTFTGEFPTAGTFRLFFDFSHDGEVRTAAFTVVVPDAAATHDDPLGDSRHPTSRVIDMSTPTPHRNESQIQLDIGGMTCASCAARIEKKLNRMDGVTASVNYATEKAKVAFDRHRHARRPDRPDRGDGLHRPSPAADGTCGVRPTNRKRRSLTIRLARFANG